MALRKGRIGSGGMSERLKEPVLKTNKPANLPHLFDGASDTMDDRDSPVFMGRL